MTELCAKSELLLFDPVATQVCVMKANWIDFHPLTNPAQGGPIEFHLPKDATSYFDLNDTMLYLKCKLHTTNVDATDTKTVLANELAPVNLLHSSLFSDVEVSLNNKQIESSDFLYAYKAYIATLLSYTSEAKNTQLKAAGYVKDEAGKFNEQTNTGHVARVKKGGVSFELCGPIHVAFFHQSKYLLPNISVNIKLVRGKDDFFLMNFSDKFKATLSIEDAVLYVRRCFVQPAVLKAHMDGMLKHNVIYPIQKQTCTTYTISQGNGSDSREIVLSSDTPKLLVVGLVRNTAFNGNLKLNPFNFEHFNLSSITLYRNGETVPFPAMEMDYANNLYMKPYIQSIQSLEMFTRNVTNGITPEDFAQGSNLYVFNLTPDLNYTGAVSQRYEQCNMRLDLKFSKTLEHSINVVIYSIYDSSLEIDSNYNIHQW